MRILALLTSSALVFTLVLLLSGMGTSDSGVGPALLPSISSRVQGLFSHQTERDSCLADMPSMLDVVTLGLAAGLSFDASLALFCERSQGVLSRELDEAMLSWRMGVSTREEALERLADKLDLAAMHRFSSVVSESLVFGAPLARTREDQAQVIRDEQRSEVEERIEQVPVRMLIPLGTLIVPAMLLAILGPLLAPAIELG